MSLKRFILKDPMASWLMGRICGYRSADSLIRAGVLLPANGIRTDYRKRIRCDALDIRRRYQDALDIRRRYQSSQGAQ